MAENDVYAAITGLRVEFAHLSESVRGLREDVVGRLQRDVSEIRRLQSNAFVTKEQFENEIEPIQKKYVTKDQLESEISPLRKFIFGTVSVILLYVLNQLLGVI